MQRTKYTEVFYKETTICKTLTTKSRCYASKNSVNAKSKRMWFLLKCMKQNELKGSTVLYLSDRNIVGLMFSRLQYFHNLKYSSNGKVSSLLTDYSIYLILKARKWFQKKQIQVVFIIFSLLSSSKTPLMSVPTFIIYSLLLAQKFSHFLASGFVCPYQIHLLLALQPHLRTLVHYRIY